MKKNTTTTDTLLVKYKTNEAKLLFIGFDGDEEYYQDTTEKEGWSFMGLRPNTEEELRERARDSDIDDYFGSKVPDSLSKYIDYDKFSDDMEADWENNHDVQATRINEEGETIYLGFGSGQGATGYFKEHNIKTYQDYCNHFEIIGLTEKEFTKFTAKYLA